MAHAGMTAHGTSSPRAGHLGTLGFVVVGSEGEPL
jgi:hypothetical protein